MMMRLLRRLTWHQVAAWTPKLILVLLVGTFLLTSVLLVLWSMSEVQAQVPVLQKEQRASLEPEALVPLLSFEASSEGMAQRAPIVFEMMQGYAELDLNVLAQAHSVDEADNVRWSLVRRTPQAVEVYQPQIGVNWTALRRISQWGTILMPAGFLWSFNETFQLGPGYKDAGGILAGGHCALATVFRSAAEQAGLPVVSRRHTTPIPGFQQEKSVNILWGRDDLVVHNTRDRDLHFVWLVNPDRVAVAVVPVNDALPLPELPDVREGTVAMVYGRPGPGGWGSLGETVIVDHALYLARTFAERVDEWNDTRRVVVAVNPNVVMAGETMERDLYLYHLIAEARRQGYYVVLDVQPGDADPLSLFEALMDKYLRDNVWFDWDIEHTAGGQVDAAQIDQVAAAYFSRRQNFGFQTPGVFGFYIFKDDQVTNPTEVRREYEGDVVVPIFDGFGGSSPNPGSDKIAKTARVLSLFGQGDFGIMEFETRWGTRYDKISARAYFEAYPDALIFASQ